MVRIRSLLWMYYNLKQSHTTLIKKIRWHVFFSLLFSVFRLEFVFVLLIYLKSFTSLWIRKIIDISCTVQKLSRNTKIEQAPPFSFRSFLPIVTIVLFHLVVFLIFYGYIELYLFSASLIFHILLALSDLCSFFVLPKDI